jgi:hexosaminidase
MNNYSIIPQPASVQYLSGSFQCSGLPRIEKGNNFHSAARIFTEQLRHTFGDLAFGNQGFIHIKKIDNPSAEKSDTKESYSMEIQSEGITLSAGAEAGAYRGLQVLRQLFLSAFSSRYLSIPCGKIDDHPRFPWRGFLLDCARHFFPVEFIKKFLDALSLQHINIFHWHLSDDQGWRLPVASYPLLTEIGSKRRNPGGEFSCAFYTETEIRDIVSFAADRHIEVVPEIDLPGHASSILAGYPGLGCTGGPYRGGNRFGIFDDLLCAGNDDIFQLAEAVYDTLAELFPSRYVHIGGDEVPFNRWAKCPRCQKRVTELGLDKTEQLQSWITSRLVQMLRKRGKIAIGWDEVLENTENFPLPDEVVVQSWRGKEGGNKATALGHRVIMSPLTNGCYLDYKHNDRPEELGQIGVCTIAQGFNLDPVTEEMDEAAASLVLGGQGNLGTEIIYAGKIAEYMTFPRICAIAEALWSQRKPKTAHDLTEFAERLAVHQSRLDKLGLLQYRGPL